jgi:hypothetical protein
VGAVFDNGSERTAAVAVQVARIHYDAPSKFCRDGKRATMGIRPVDYIRHLWATWTFAAPTHSG